MQVYVDLDGVLADFDGYHDRVFGWSADRTSPDGGAEFGDEHWREISAIDMFYQQLPLMHDALDLWHDVDELIQYHGLGSARILTGLPSSMPTAAADKREWVEAHIGAHAADKMICCRSRDKAKHCRPGDIIIDDWARYRPLWLAAGGRWILHTSAQRSVAELRTLLQGCRPSML